MAGGESGEGERDWRGGPPPRAESAFLSTRRGPLSARPRLVLPLPRCCRPRFLPLVAHSALELRVRVQLDDDVAVLRGGEGDRVRRFAVVLLLRVDERVVAHLSLVVSEDGLCAALGGADAREVPPERHAFTDCSRPSKDLRSRKVFFVASLEHVLCKALDLRRAPAVAPSPC